MPTELKPGVYWVGVVDWELRHFHGHELSTHRGSTYNSYLIVDEKIALVDTVWTPFSARLMANIAEIIDPARIDYVITNHAEIDHSGALADVLRAAPQAEVIVSKRGEQSLEGHFHQGWKVRSVGTGERLSLGKNELLFIEAPMLHWPDSMFTYLTGLNILMPNDAFGQHYASAFRFNDQVNREELYEEALKYYANILTPFSTQVLRKLDEFSSLGLPVDIIAPSHGVIWRDDPMQIVHHYAQWARQEPEPRAVVLYDTMWNGTRRMAEAIGRGLADAGVDYKVFHAATADRNDALKEVFKARTVLVGSPTLNNGVLPTIWPVLQDLKGLKFKNKIAGAFGCYGWSGEGIDVIGRHLDDCGFERIGDGLRIRWHPSEQNLSAAREFGQAAGARTLAG